MFIITVEGEIIAKEKIHYAQEWTCIGNDYTVTNYSYRYNPDNHTVQSNLILNKSIRAVPYATYFTKSEIKAQSPGDVAVAPGASAAELCYKDNILEVEELFNDPIPPKIEIFFYNGLLTGIFGILELFLSDVLLCLIFRDHDIYKRALDFIIMKKEEKNGKKYYISDPDLAIHQFFTKEIVYHKFDKIKPIFKHILNISLPDTKCFIPYLHKRNNIAHRFAFSNIDRMQMTEINLNTLKEFIRCCNEFVENIMDEINKRY